MPSDSHLPSRRTFPKAIQMGSESVRLRGFARERADLKGLHMKSDGFNIRTILTRFI